jgi:hypothetical protein
MVAVTVTAAQETLHQPFFQSRSFSILFCFSQPLSFDRAYYSLFCKTSKKNLRAERENVQTELW